MELTGINASLINSAILIASVADPPCEEIFTQAGSCFFLL